MSPATSLASTVQMPYDGRSLVRVFFSWPFRCTSLTQAAQGRQAEVWDGYRRGKLAKDHYDSGCIEPGLSSADMERGVGWGSHPHLSDIHADEWKEEERSSVLSLCHRSSQSRFPTTMCCSLSGSLPPTDRQERREGLLTFGDRPNPVYNSGMDGYMKIF